MLQGLIKAVQEFSPTPSKARAERLFIHSEDHWISVRHLQGHFPDLNPHQIGKAMAAAGFQKQVKKIKGFKAPQRGFNVKLK